MILVVSIADHRLSGKSGCNQKEVKRRHFEGRNVVWCTRWFCVWNIEEFMDFRFEFQG